MRPINTKQTRARAPTTLPTTVLVRSPGLFGVSAAMVEVGGCVEELEGDIVATGFEVALDEGSARTTVVVIIVAGDELEEDRLAVGVVNCTSKCWVEAADAQAR